MEGGGAGAVEEPGTTYLGPFTLSRFPVFSLLLLLLLFPHRPRPTRAPREIDPPIGRRGEDGRAGKGAEAKGAQKSRTALLAPPKRIGGSLDQPFSAKRRERSSRLSRRRASRRASASACRTFASPLHVQRASHVHFQIGHRRQTKHYSNTSVRHTHNHTPQDERERKGAGGREGGREGRQRRAERAGGRGVRTPSKMQKKREKGRKKGK